jgi:hypothetical protein
MTDYHAEGVKLLAYVPEHSSVETATLAARTRRFTSSAATQIFPPCDPCPTRTFSTNRRKRNSAQSLSEVSLKYLPTVSDPLNRTTSVLSPSRRRSIGSLQEQPGPGGFYEDVSPIFRLPNGGTFFIGNIRAAASLEVLKANKITHIINAQDVETENFFETGKRGRSDASEAHAFTYLRFPIAHWWQAPNMETSVGVRRFFEPLFSFCDKALKRGENVMVHCLAGAHRAGTSGVSLVMYFLKLSASQAVGYVRERRPIVDPIGSFPDLLKRLEKALREKKSE